MSNTPRSPQGVTPGPLVEVENPDDPRLDLYRDLNNPAVRIRREGEQAVFVVEGRLAVRRLLESDFIVHSLLVDDHQVAAVSDLVAATRARGAPVFVGRRAVVADTVGFALHRGVVAVGHRPPPADAGQLLTDAAALASNGAPPLLAVLEGLNDHENIGALFRNAAAFGVAGILLDPTCADPLYRRSVRVSVGHVLHIPFARLAPWPTGLRQVSAAGFAVVALTPRASEVGGMAPVSLAELKDSMFGPDRPVGVALLLGAEGPGLTDAALAACDLRVSIPMAEGVDSLNVAAAAAVAFHALTDL